MHRDDDVSCCLECAVQISTAAHCLALSQLTRGYILLPRKNPRIGVLEPQGSSPIPCNAEVTAKESPTDGYLTCVDDHWMIQEGTPCCVSQSQSFCFCFHLSSLWVFRGITNTLDGDRIIGWLSWKVPKGPPSQTHCNARGYMPIWVQSALES